MKIAVVGAGAAGIIYAIMRKRLFPQDEIIILEKEPQMGKKIYATGNGKCNILPAVEEDFLYQQYRHPILAQSVFNKLGIEELKTFFESLGLDLKRDDNRYYPYTESAKTVMDVFKFWLKEYGVSVKLNSVINDYYRNQKIVIALKDEKLIVDRLIIATGGCSSPHLGSNGSFFSILKAHHYDIKECVPGLVAIQVKENIESLEGTRFEANITLFENDHAVFKEKGEVQFKKDGLSGIAIMNASLWIARNKDKKASYRLSLDLFPDETKDSLAKRLIDKTKNGYPYLDGSLPTSLARYIEKITHTRGKKTEEEINRVVEKMKSLTFECQALYTFANSQVTVGGIDIHEIDEEFRSKKEQEVYFIGEIIDNDGPCGGYNLMWAWASAIKAAKSK